ncbi:Pentatricopeptide repeat-containing protein [Vitis vinifera]|uniref:Pentatricopeptide repeat-containing protein n=1 Tax=Vitis vinifera TaxID=29760 RepID=A0A438KLW0_VITVI|nr:Pentatricopeptide repeat-containing protein [Vitis vinifera]
MFVKLHCLDTNCFQVLSARGSPNIGDSASSSDKVEFIKKRRVQKVPESPNGGVKRFSRVCRQTHHDRRKCGASQKPGLNQHGFVKDPERKQRRHSGRDYTPVNSTYGTLIDVYSKGGLTEEALHWLDRMNKQGMEPDEVTMGVVVQTYKKAGEFKKSRAILQELVIGSYTYNTLIDTYGKAGQLREASDTFAWMLTRRDYPKHSDIQYNDSHLWQSWPARRSGFVDAENGRTPMAASYFKKMKEARLEPDLVSYRTLLYAFSIRHLVGEAEILVSEMDERGLEIDEFTQSALTRMYIEAGMLKKSWLWFRRFHLEGNMSSECYSANIDAYGERGHILEAEKAFLCCKESRKLSVLEFNVMIKAYGISNRYEKACQLIDSMENHGVLPDKFSYNSLIQILASADLPHKASQLEMAEGLFKEMIGYNVQPDVVVYGILINAFADVGNVREAVNYVNAMRNAGLPMNAVIYNSLIKLYTKVGYLEEAQEAYKMLQASEVGPDVYSSNCMIDLYSERSMVKQAEEIFESLKRKGDANEFSFAMMLCMYKRIGKLKEAFQIVQKMRELGLVTDLLSYNNVLGFYAMDGRFKDAVGTFKEMIEAAIQPDDCTFKSLGVVLVKCGIPKQAVGKLEMTRKKDPQSGLQAWASILFSVVEVDDTDAQISCSATSFSSTVCVS